jgi:hypothetical protein
MTLKKPRAMIVVVVTISLAFAAGMAVPASRAQAAGAAGVKAQAAETSVLIARTSGTSESKALAAANKFLGSKKRTISSPDGRQHQVWHIQFWQTPPQPNVCDIFGRNLMDSFTGSPYEPFDYLDSVRLTDLTTGFGIAGRADAGYPPIAIQTQGYIRIGKGVQHKFRVRGTARVDWFGFPIGPSGLHEYERYILCV